MGTGSVAYDHADRMNGDSVLRIQPKRQVLEEVPAGKSVFDEYQYLSSGSSPRTHAHSLSLSLVW